MTPRSLVGPLEICKIVWGYSAFGLVKNLLGVFAGYPKCFFAPASYGLWRYADTGGKVLPLDAVLAEVICEFHLQPVA